MSLPANIFRSLMYNKMYTPTRDVKIVFFTFEANGGSDPDPTTIYPDGVIAKDNTSLSIVGLDHSATGVITATCSFKVNKFLGGFVSCMDADQDMFTQAVENPQNEGENDLFKFDMHFKDTGGDEDPDATTPVVCWFAFQ